MSQKTEGIAKRQAILARAQYEDMLCFFDYKHLPEGLQAISKPFNKLAHSLVEQLPDHSQKMVALQKLLEAKDAAVRIAVAKTKPQRERIQNLIIENHRNGLSASEIHAKVQEAFPNSKITEEVIKEFALTLEAEV
ncbi:hypothetical protein [Sneathiella limimaris]|uniref:hypothetical protein n=1 Tax=Sneathiella limimaris TaxID=1964213 RepID=UPI00146B786F|nr:hypothetical protein [Sneathiella limimaris]